MVRSMMNLTTLPLSFWDYALESATRILNMVPTKKVDKTPYELWYGKVPNLSYLKVWGCEALVKRDTLDKLQQRSVKFKKSVGRAVDLDEIQEEEDTKTFEITSNIPQRVGGFETPQEEVIRFVGPGRPSSWLKVGELQRSIYGLKQASRSWNKRFDEEIKRFGFTQNLDEPCVYQKASGRNVTFLILYVDDIIIMGNHIPSLQSVKDYLGKCFAMKDLGEAAFILGIKIYRDRSKRLIGLCQNAYMDKILKRYKMDNSKRGHIPMQERLDLNKSQGAQNLMEVNRHEDCSYASANPGDLLVCYGKTILKYLRILRYVLVYGGNPSTELERSGLEKFQESTTAMSATESEYIAASEAAMEAVWIRKFISGLGIVPTINELLNMYCRQFSDDHHAYRKKKCVGGHPEHFVMNDKSKDTAKGKDKLANVGHSKWLWLGQTKHEECLKHQVAYSFTPEEPKKFVSTSKAKRPDGIFCSATLEMDDRLKALNQGGRFSVRSLSSYILLLLYDIMICQRHVDNDQDPEVSTTSELFALANGPSWTLFSKLLRSRVWRFVCTAALQEILEFKYLLFKVALFRVKWFDTSNKGHGQSTVVDAPLDIIDVPDEDDDIIDVVSRCGGPTEVVGGGDDRSPIPHVVPTVAGAALLTKAKVIAEAKGLVSIHFDVGDKQTLNPLGPHAAHWSNYIGEVVRSVPLYYPSWEKVPKERKAALISNIGTLFDLRPHMESSRWTEIYEGINQHLQKAYNTNKASFKAKHWKVDPQTGTYDVEAIRRARPEEITADEWDNYIRFWNDPKNLARAAQNRQNRQKSVVISRQGSRSLARLRDEMRQASDTQEYPSLIDTFWRTHTVDGVFPKDEDRRIYEEMKRLEATGEYTEDEINALARGGKLRGHIPGVGRVLPSRATSRPSMPAPDKSLKSMHRKVDFMMSLFRSDSKYSDMFKEFESGGASGSGGCGDDEESGDDEDGDGDD
ncbi:F-box domain containing protein [Tanacetum coccineum]|uniref:F-box domain containing protein n=1 Tax=Tanacetum coccineum TaxID=301880 RepID=A0ABQ5HK84_9ASTR